MADLDQGGTFRVVREHWMGPSMGWQQSYGMNARVASNAGLIFLNLGTGIVNVGTAGAPPPPPSLDFSKPTDSQYIPLVF